MVAFSAEMSAAGEGELQRPFSMPISTGHPEGSWPVGGGGLRACRARGSTICSTAYK